MQQTGNKAKKITQLVQGWLEDEPQRIRVRSYHIEQERIWRDIVTQDVLDALKDGKVMRIRESDSTLIWQGQDQSDRNLELLCSLVSIQGVDTLFIQEASALRIGTAYEVNVDDEQLKQEWLQDNPDYELTSDGMVRKREKKL